MASTAHQTWGRERNFPSRGVGCLQARPLALALCRLERLIRSPLCRKPSRGVGCLPARPLASALRWLAPFIESFLLHQIPCCFPAGPRIYTGLSCLSTGVIIYPSPLSCKCSLLPVKGSRTNPQLLCPMSESPSGKREGSQDNATRKNREVYY